MFKIILIVTVIIAFSEIKTYSQNGFENYLKKDSTYRFNSSLKDLDSLFNIQTETGLKDTAFFNSYGKAEVFTLNQLLFAAVNNNPELSAMQTKIEASDYQAEGKTYLPDPMFEVELDDIMSDFKRIGMINFFVSQMFPFPGKLELEKKAVLNSKAMMQSERLTMAIDIMNMIKMNYYDLYLVNYKLKINKENRLLMQTFLASSEAQYTVGKGMQQEVFKAQIEISRLDNEEFILIQQRKNIFSELTRLTKIVVDENTKISFSDIDTEYLMNDYSFNINFSKNKKLIEYAFEHRPDIKTLHNKILMNQTDLEMSKLERYPDFNIKLGYKILPFEEKNAFALMFGVNIPFAPWSSGKYDQSIRRNEIMIKSTTDELSIKKNDIRNEITAIVNNMTALKETMKFYYGVQMPQTENTMKSAQYSYETNMGSFLELLDAYKMYQETKLMYYESVAMYLKMIAELEKATGLNLKN
ncbi:MAG: Outer membrane efflux protein precursor [Chlorobi bacterium OLB5]|nr:MAG: Outer membrane efflux protein precursor [Chlorobi bacterium OLB5]